MVPYGHMGGHITVATSDLACYCGKTGCLESLVSATGLVEAAKRVNWSEKHPQLPGTAEQIFRERTEGNADAQGLVAQLLTYLKIGIDTYINLFAPNIIILGGGLAKGLKPYLADWSTNAVLGPYTTYQVVLTTSHPGRTIGHLGQRIPV